MVIIYYLILWKCGIPCTQYRQVELVTSCGKNMFIVLFILAQSEWMCLCTPLVHARVTFKIAGTKINNPPGYKRIKLRKCLSKTITLPFYRQLKPKIFALFISLVESTSHQVCDTSLSWPKCEIKTKWVPLWLYLKTIQGACSRVNGILNNQRNLAYFLK